MKICMIVHAFYESDTRVLQYTKALIERGDEVDVLSLRAEGTLAFEVLEGVRVFRVMKRNSKERKPLDYLIQIMQFMAIVMYYFGRKLRLRKYDAVHVHSVPDFLAFTALLPKLSGARIILDIHDILPEFYASKFQLSPSSLLFRALLFCEKSSIAFSNHVIIANEIWHERLVSRSVSEKKCTTIQNYPDPEIFFPRPKQHDNSKFLIIYPGTLNRHQGLDIAVRAFAKVAGQMTGAEFWIYGQGPEMSALIELKATLGLQERVYINGFIAVQEIAKIMSQADLAVIPKRVSSGFGNEAASTKLMEFMSLGVPIIVSKTKIDSFYHDDSMVKFVESENEDALAEAIYDLYQHPKIKEQLIQAGLRYTQEHSWDQRKSIYFNIIDGVI